VTLLRPSAAGLRREQTERRGHNLSPGLRPEKQNIMPGCKYALPHPEKSAFFNRHETAG